MRRKISNGIGVEKTFPVHSPTIAKIEVATLGDVRRAKLYYLRDRHGKAAKIKERRLPRGKVANAVEVAANVEVVDEVVDVDDVDDVVEADGTVEADHAEAADE